MADRTTGLPTINGHALDYYLSVGYYRMQQDLFTCRFMPREGRLHTVHWLRFVLGRVQYGGWQRRLLRQNARFVVAVRPFRITPEYETLYAHYWQSLNFEAAPTLANLLLDGSPHSVFNTEIIEVRDGAELVAAGIFDSGHFSIMGIVNFYHPAYRRHSPGKYLMLLKLELARQRRQHYYYPGYIVQGYAKFDYKLTVCPAATEVFDCLRQHWLPFSTEEVAAQSTELLTRQALADDNDDAERPGE